MYQTNVLIFASSWIILYHFISVITLQLKCKFKVLPHIQFLPTKKLAFPGRSPPMCRNRVV